MPGRPSVKLCTVMAQQLSHVTYSTADTQHTVHAVVQSSTHHIRLCVCRYKDAGGKSMETLEAVKHSKATLEAQLNTQRSLIENMRVELAGAKVSHHL